MEIDFHFATTYVLSRMAGFTPDQANIIAYSSQYVDDAGTYFASQGLKIFEWHAVFFDNYAMFEYIDSSHSMYDLGMWKELDQHKVWIPFHFIPGGFGNDFIKKAVCVKAWDIEAQWTNPIARDMVDEVIKNAGSYPWGLHRLGITMHVLADTFAHQNFAGIKCPDVNDVSDIKINSPKGYPVPGTVIRNLPPLGHARAEHLPDLPFLVWDYADGQGKRVVRDNPHDYTSAIDIMYKTLAAYKQKYFGPGGPSQDDVAHDRHLIISMFTELTNKDGDARNKEWCSRIKQGQFKCCPGTEKADYYAEGQKNSWWDTVTKLCAWSKDPKWWALGYRQFNEGFMTCNYKMFQDALKAHFYYVTKILFAKHNVCAL